MHIARINYHPRKRDGVRISELPGVHKAQIDNHPQGVIVIEVFTFLDCTSLTSVTISEGVRIIQSGAFSGCTSLASVTIPKTVTELEGNAFPENTVVERRQSLAGGYNPAVNQRFLDMFQSQNNAMDADEGRRVGGTQAGGQ